MYKLEYSSGDGWRLWGEFVDPEQAISAMRGAQISDIRNGLGRSWRITPYPWPAPDTSNPTHRSK